MIPTRDLRPTKGIESLDRSVVPGLLLVAVCVLASDLILRPAVHLPTMVMAVLAGATIGNLGLAGPAMAPGLAFAAKTVLRCGIVLLGLRLSIAEVLGLGAGPLLVVVATVVFTFFGVQLVGRRLGLSAGLSLLAASGFSICGNSAIASVKGVSDASEEDVAAAIGLVTLCGSAAIVVVPWLGELLELSDPQLGAWVGASVQDTAQVIATGSAAGPAVLVIATAVKLTRVLFLAPIVGGVSLYQRRSGQLAAGERSPVVPLFVVGFAIAMLVRTSGVVSAQAIELSGEVSSYSLAAGMVGLGASVRVEALHRLGSRVLMLGAISWGIVATVSLVSIEVLGV